MKLVISHAPSDGVDTFTVICFEYESAEKLYADLKEKVEQWLADQDKINELKLKQFDEVDSDRFILEQVIYPYSVIQGDTYLYAGEFIGVTYNFPGNKYTYHFDNPTIVTLDDWFASELENHKKQEYTRPSIEDDEDE